MKAVIYKVTCTKAYMMEEQGTRYSLKPWGSDTADYEGYDDGGQEYVLPDGYSVCEGKDLLPHIYDARNRFVVLCGNNAPTIIDNDTRKYITLKKA